MEIWIWQLMVSPHMAGLAKSLSELGHTVIYVAESEMSPERSAQGWTLPDLGRARLVMAPNKTVAKNIAKTAPEQAIHICQGIRANGVVGSAQKMLRKLRRKHFVVMETVDDSGWQGVVKRLLYEFLFRRLSPYLMGVLANGTTTREWVIRRGVDPRKVFPFAYFLPEIPLPSISRPRNTPCRYRVLFVGQFIELKRLDLLIRAISHHEFKDIELAVVGSGPLEMDLRAMAQNALPDQVDWIGRLPIDEVRAQMARAGCLVLPSRYDGWGAVVSEALMSGTPVICSDTCGSSAVVRASGLGGVFESGDAEALRALLRECIQRGKLSAAESDSLAVWARCLGEGAGAGYLIKIISAVCDNRSPPAPPWLANQSELGRENIC